ncbi:MAG TPA: hypothetical protein VM431_12170 [Phycisphaerae bacterium]|nr:hypothetical protein [Phycisphaerae bacterium]
MARYRSPLMVPSAARQGLAALAAVAALAACGCGGPPSDSALSDSAAPPAPAPDAPARPAVLLIQGWYRTQDGRPIGRGAVLASHREGERGYELYGRSSGTLALWLGDGRQPREVVSPQVYTESGQWVYFAVSFAGTDEADDAAPTKPGRIAFYKGTDRTPVRLAHQAAVEWAVPRDLPGEVSIGARADGSRAFAGNLKGLRVMAGTLGPDLASIEKRRRDDLADDRLGPPDRSPGTRSPD